MACAPKAPAATPLKPRSAATTTRTRSGTADPPACAGPGPVVRAPGRRRGDGIAMGEVAVEVVRGGRVESRHRVDACVVDATGGVVLASGPVDAPVYPRSAVKP